MINKEHLTLDKIYSSKLPIYYSENENIRLAVITHYLQNYKYKKYKNEAFRYIKDYLKVVYPDESISNNIAEDALQYMAFETENIPFPPPFKPKFSFIDLFAGVGGFRIAMQNLGGKCVFSSEWDKSAQKTYHVNFGEIPFGDIRKTEIQEFIPDMFDILCAGFPCQAFSIAGKREGFADTRGTLFFEIENIIKNHRPKVVFLENVKNLVSHDKGKTFKVIYETLKDKLGYHVYFKVLNSMSYANMPHNRERIFIVAFEPDLVRNYEKFVFPDKIELSKNIHDIIDKDRQEDIFYYPSSHPYYEEFVKSINSNDTIYQWRRMYVRENKSNVCPTLTANMGTGGHNVPIILDNFGFRKLTPKECFAFQGFPENFILPNIANSKLYTQAGNSVTIPLIERIGLEIFKVMNL